MWGERNTGELPAIGIHMKWISVKDQIPPEGTPVLVYSNDEVPTHHVDYIVMFPEDTPPYIWARSRIGDGARITHWMGLPDPPVGNITI